MKSSFMRQFLVTAALILASFVMLGAAFRTMLFNHLTQEEQTSLQTNATAVADLAAAYDSAGEVKDNWNFQMSMTYAASVSDTDIVVCAPDGKIIVCSCDRISCEHKGKIVDQSYIDRVISTGSQFDTGIIDGLYSDARYALSVPIASDLTGLAIGIVMVSEPCTQITDLLQRTINVFLTTAFLALILALALTSVFAKRQVEPLTNMAAAACRFGGGELDVRVPTGRGAREVDELASAFNAMADSMEKAEMRRSEFVANVSHELKTPMTTIGGFIDGILDGTIPPEREKEYLQTVSSEIKRLSRLVRSMLEVSRLQSGQGATVQKTEFNLCALLGSTLLTYEKKINDKHLEVEAELPDGDVFGYADPDTITQVTSNLLDNAVKFCNEGGHLRLGLTEAEGKALVTVENTGATIPPEELRLIFDRFHKTDKSRSVDKDGVGLGLYIVKALLQSHGETVTVTSRDGVTAFRFTVTLANKKSRAGGERVGQEKDTAV
ncbi:MAG: HAMP domain-containing sensor histidine kinase [Oscillospiraceae bacterium]|nr:HAMP domain-containing sensor histidine kinase [Oscillospiraceae bacterium]